MRLPIQYAFSYPDRWDAPVPLLDLTRCGALEFHEPAWDDFPCLGLAYRALEAERSLPIVLNAANEVAVAAFLAGRIAFPAIPRLIRAVMDAHSPATVETVTAIRKVDASAREEAAERVAKIADLKVRAT
jgi:1-deoxy-D-xylulose-5-phosphate reductoisomerase